MDRRRGCEPRQESRYPRRECRFRKRRLRLHHGHTVHPLQSDPAIRRITRSSKRKTDVTTFTGSNKALSSPGGKGKGTNLDEIAWLIANLKETITQQSRVIEELKASQQELKAGQKELATQNAALQTQIPTLKTQLQSTPARARRGHQLQLAEPTTRQTPT